MAEWLRRLTRNQIPSGSVGSNPTDRAGNFFFVLNCQLSHLRIVFSSSHFLISCFVVVLVVNLGKPNFLSKPKLPASLPPPLTHKQENCLVTYYVQLLFSDSFLSFLYCSVDSINDLLAGKWVKLLLCRALCAAAINIEFGYNFKRTKMK